MKKTEWHILSSVRTSQVPHRLTRASRFLYVHLFNITSSLVTTAVELGNPMPACRMILQHSKSMASHNVHCVISLCQQLARR